MHATERRAFLRRLGTVISQIRKSKGIGQDRLTEEAGLARGTVSKIERGVVDPKATTLVRLARALQVRIASLLDTAV